MYILDSFCEIFETVFLLMLFSTFLGKLKCLLEWKRVLFLHIFWQVSHASCDTGPDFALLPLLLDTYGEEVEFCCARPRQNSGRWGLPD